MAYTGNDSDEWLPDSDDSNEEDGEDEEDERPNRWEGPPSTWQQLNIAEIDTFTALNELHKQDLSIHLYNAFALKHRHDKSNKPDGAKPVPNQDIDVATGQLVKEDKWVPPKQWTAWPLPANVVPRPDFMKRTDPADEHFTYKMQISYSPKAELEEVISATILRAAKEKFNARKAAMRVEDSAESSRGSSDGENSDIDTSPATSRRRSKSRAKSRSKSRVIKRESASESGIMDIDDLHTARRSTSITPKRASLKPVIATDDELSYTLLRPSVHRILAKLDTTLRILHNAQESKANCPSESEASDVSSLSQSRSRSRSREPSAGTRTSSPDARHRRTNSRAPSQARESAAPETSIQVKKRGRPKKEYPRLEGETDKEFAIRIARLRKQPIPYFSDDDPEPVSDSVPNNKGKNPRGRPRTYRARTQAQQRRRSSTAVSDITSAGETSEKQPGAPRLTRARLRDWKDVLGAAALAGFPVAALDRAARRCADLFGESFVLHTLKEGPPGQTGLDDYVRYEPGMAIPPLLSDPEASSDGERLSQTPHAVSISETPAEGGDDGGPQQQQQQQQRPIYRRRPAGSGPLEFYCSVSNCPRAVDPFTRRLNLLRHMKLIHMYEGGDDEFLPAGVDSEDEMHGAVHVDGFLRPLKVRPGWRGDDPDKEMRRPRTRASVKSMTPRGERGDGEDKRMRDVDVDSTTGNEESE